MTQIEKNSNDELFQLLFANDLEIFYSKIRNQLQINQISHFNYVKPKDFEEIGLPKPAIRRLLDSDKESKKKFSDLKSFSFTGSTNLSTVNIFIYKKFLNILIFI